MNGMWKGLLVVWALIVLGGAATGVVLAQSGDETPAATEQAAPTDDEATPSDDTTLRDEIDYLARLADNLGISQDELEAAIKATNLEVVDKLVADGVIDEERAADIRERIDSGEGPGFFGPGFFGPGGPHPGFAHGVALDQLADFLGMTEDEFMQAKQDGQTLAEIAEARGVSVDDLTAFLLAQIEEQVSDAVANGRIDQAQADEILADAPGRIDDLINSEGPPFPGRHFGPPGPWDGGGFRDFGGDDTPAEEGLTGAALPLF